MDWNTIQLADGSFGIDLLVPINELRSNDPAFDAALAKAVEAQGRSFIEVQGSVKQSRFEGVIRIAEVSKQISLPVQAERKDGILVTTATATVDPSKCGVLLPGVTKATLSVTFRLPASGNAVFAGGSSRFVN